MPANKKIWALPKEKLSEEELKVKKEKLNKLLKEREDPNLTKFFKEMEEFKALKDVGEEEIKKH